MYNSFFIVFVSFIIISFDFNILYSIRIINLLENKIVLWNARALYIRSSDAFDKGYSKEMLQIYVNILKCYDLYKQGFQHFVSIL